MTTTAIDHTYRYGFASEYVPRFEGSDHGRLASVRDNDYVALNIGAEQIELSKNAEKAVERKVSLPVRWFPGATSATCSS